MKSKFAAEVRRNLFQAYLRPRQTLINLISVNASSSAALPGAEAFRFAFSPNGQTILALSSSRIYVIDATSDPIAVRKELKTQRRPLSASVTDDGTILAVLSSRHQANIYDIGPDGVKHVQVLVMDNPPRTIALAPEGTVLAAAYEGGVEVFSLAPSALSTDRRAVRSEGVDILGFSGDGSMLVGSTQSLEEPSSVVITAPFYTENDLPPKEVHSRMWTTQILFPQISSICSHAELLQGHTEGDANWLFAYDHTLMSYRAVRTDDTRTGVAYFLNPSSTRRFSLPAPSTAPTATACGTLVVAGFGGTGLWIYGVPEKLDVSPDMGSVVERHEHRLHGRGVSLTSATGHMEPLMAYSPSISGSSEDFEDDSIAAKVDWRESLFVKCQRIRSIEGCTAVKWVEKSEDRPCAFSGKRLVVVAPGGVDQFVEELGDETMPVDGSRVCILDFDYAPSVAADREITIEVGEEEPELLTEQIGDMDIEVAMERRRTVRARGGRGMPLGRSITTVSPSQGLWSQRRTSSSQPTSPLDVDAQIEKAQAEAARSPRTPSSATLHRSATAAGFTTARYPPRPPLAAPGDDSGHVVYHRAPGQMYPPGDGWESPPPPYSNTGHAQTQLHPGFMLGSPLVHPRQLSGSGATPMPLLGIPENGNTQTGTQGRPISPALHANHVPPIPQTQGQRPSQNTPFAPQNVSPITPLTGGGVNGLPQPGQYGPAPPRSVSGPSNLSSGSNIPIPPINPAFGVPAPPVSRDSSSRPQSHDGRPSPFQTPVSQRHQTGDRAHPSPPNLDRPSQAPIEGSVTAQQQQAQNRLSNSSITLTGSNLQARLNHPVPPTPTTLDHMRSSQDGQHRPQGSPSSGPMPPRTQVITAGGPYGLGLGPADQMTHMARHHSQAQRKPVPHTVTNGGAYADQNIPTRDFSGGSMGQNASGNNGWIAPGGLAPPSFNKPLNIPNGDMRHGSRGGSGGSIPMSSSTPDLLATMHHQRPTAGRLDTLENMQGSSGRGDPRVYASSPSYVPPAAVGMYAYQQNSRPNASLQSQPSLQAPYLQQPTQMPGAWIAPDERPEMRGRRVSSDPTMLETPSKKKKAKRKKGEPIAEPGRSQTPMPTSNSGPPPPGKKGSRCVVM